MRLLVALVLAQATTAAAQARPPVGVIDAVVTDTSLVPLPEATVSLVGTSVRLVTADNGRLRSRAPIATPAAPRSSTLPSGWPKPGAGAWSGWVPGVLMPKME